VEKFDPARGYKYVDLRLLGVKVMLTLALHVFRIFFFKAYDETMPERQ
jgi:hypothetical protein